MKIGITVAELEDWRSDALLGFNPAKADKRILTLIGEVKRLQEALEKHGRHPISGSNACALYRRVSLDAVCDCGFAEALEGESKE